MTEGLHGGGAASTWVQRWAHLVAPGGNVLDLACGQGRHMAFFAARGHGVTGVDRSPEALAVARQYGEVLQADIENGPWPFDEKPGADAGKADPARLFDAVVVTNYLWRPLFPAIRQSLAINGVLIYETFAIGNETVGKPSRPAFLLQPGELLNAFAGLTVIAYENGFVAQPARFVQRLVAVRAPGDEPGAEPTRYLL